MRRMHSSAASFMLALVCLTSVIFLVADRNVLADVPTEITSSGLNTQVGIPTLLPSGEITHDITGGTRPGNGANLFHSFGDFNVGTNNIANFLNDSGLPTTNILGRVTGGDVSNIFGTIQTTGFGNANLFLMNPAGFLFGSTATVNVGGMMTFTTADYMRLTDGARFKAMPNAAADMLLSAAPVAAFGFLGSNPGAITVQGSQFSVANGTGISLVGGNIMIESGTSEDGAIQPASLSAPSGHINLVSVNKPKNSGKGGEISATDFSPSSTLGFKSFGTVRVENGATISTSTDGVSSGLSGGTVLIRAGQFTVVNSHITAEGIGNTSQTASPAGNIEVHADSVTLDHATLSVSSDRSRGGQVTFSDLDNLSSSHSVIEAIGGKRTSSGADTVVRGGSIQIGSSTTKSVELTDTAVSAFVFDSGGPPAPLGSNAGDITITGQQLLLDHSSFDTHAGPHSGRLGGVITLNGNHIDILNQSTLRSVDTSGGGGGGSIIIQGLMSDQSRPTLAKTVTIDNSTLLTSSSSGGQGGNILIHANAVTLTNAALSTTSFRHGGTINLTDVGRFTSTNSVLSSSGIRGGGTIILGSLNTQSVLLQSTTLSVHAGGFEPAAGGTIDITASKQFTSIGSTLDASSALGNGGTVSIRAGRISVTDGSTITAQGAGPGQEGTIHLQFDKKLTVKDSVITPTATSISGWDGN